MLSAFVDVVDILILPNSVSCLFIASISCLAWVTCACHIRVSKKNGSSRIDLLSAYIDVIDRGGNFYLVQ
jgi:hypothetical protein